MKPDVSSILIGGYQAASNLIFFRWLHTEPVFKSWFNLVQVLLEGGESRTPYYDFLTNIYPLALATSGDAWEYYLDRQVLLMDNDLTRRLQNPEPLAPPLLKTLAGENACLAAVRGLNATTLGQLCQELLGEPVPIAAGWSLAQPQVLIPWAQRDLVSQYQHCGSGPATIYPVLRWSQATGMMGVVHPDTIDMDDLIGYGRQKDALITNTQRLLTGLPAQHALLYGPRGSGKSSMIKAVARLFYQENLRLIELTSQDLAALPAIVDYVRGRRQFFIVYIDDLSFEAYETDYKFLKNILEGGVESRPHNLVIYATSNRRHIIQENYSDRLDGDDLHPAETRQEKLALADRFGLSIYFPSADQALYLEMVISMAHQRGIKLPDSELIARALTWEKERSGPSGRTARQFVDSL